MLELKETKEHHEKEKASSLFITLEREGELIFFVVIFPSFPYFLQH